MKVLKLLVLEIRVSFSEFSILHEPLTVLIMMLVLKYRSAKKIAIP